MIAIFIIIIIITNDIKGGNGAESDSVKTKSQNPNSSFLYPNKIIKFKWRSNSRRLLRTNKDLSLVH